MADEEASSSGLNLGGAISGNLADSIKNMDIMSVLQKMLDTAPVDDESEEARDKLKGVLEQLSGMDDEERGRLVEKIKEGLVKKLNERLNDPNIKLTGIEEAIKQAIVQKLYMVGAAALLIFIILVFFGYKLYKSIKDKEKKKEDKKKAKQMKKKK